jgi:hypothetical protein
VQPVRELDQFARDDIRAGKSFLESALTDAAIRGIPTKRLQATIEARNVKLEHERYQREEAAREVNI